MNNWSARKVLWGCLAGLLLCALLSVYKGQDTNWDLLNYHRYIAYALVHDRLHADLAPAGLQSYFNPSLEVPVYWLTEHLPGWWVGAIVGAWHGLIFVLTLLIAREVWPQAHPGRPWLVVAAGVLAPVFWAGLGNQMGDNAAAVFALGAVWTAIQCIRRLSANVASGWAWCASTGLLLGLCAALKLTNATVAIALGLAMLTGLPVRPALYLRVVACLLPCGLLGFGLGGGWWFWEVWQTFGNPFFPQFGGLFPSALADNVSIVDKRFIVESVGGLILRPVLMLLNYQITSEFFVLPLLWPCWFAIGMLWLVRGAWQRLRPGITLGPAWRGEQRMILVYVLLACVFWALLFGIYRYTAAMEPLLPLCMVLLLDRAGCLARLAPWLHRLLWVSIVCTLCGGAVNWGHTGWAAQTYRTDAPVEVQGDKPLVIVVGSGNSWVLPFMPPRASFTSVANAAVFGRRFQAEVQRRAQAADHVYAVVGMSQNWRFDVVDKANAYLGTMGVLDAEGGCQRLGHIVAKYKPHAGLARCEGASCAHRCQLTKLDADQAEVDRRDRAAIDEAVAALQPLGLWLDPAQCQVQSAYLGTKRYGFRLCELGAAAPAR